MENRVNFRVDGHGGFVLVPENPADGRPWVWRAEFFGAFDSADKALFEKGYHLAYYKVSDMYGCPEAIRLFKRFHDEVVEKLALSHRADIFGFSRGGLYTVNYAAEYPLDVSTIYLDAPVLDIKSWPGGMGASMRCQTEWTECLECYGLADEASAKAFTDIPLNKADKLAADGTPVLLVAGGADKDVPYAENGELFAKRYAELGGTIKTIVKPDCGHHPHSLDDPSQLVEFIIENRRI